MLTTLFECQFDWLCFFLIVAQLEVLKRREKLLEEKLDHELLLKWLSEKGKRRSI